MNRRSSHKKKKSWMGEILSGTAGEKSSKRVISMLGFILLALAFVLNLFRGLKVEEYMWDGMITLVIFGLGFVASEKFAGLVSKGRSRYEEDDYDDTGSGREYGGRSGNQEDDGA